MTAVPFPVLSAPGRHPQAAGGRLINCYPEKLSGTAGQQYAYWRVPGLKAFGTTGGTNYRGSLLVGNTLYVVVDNRCYSISSNGGAATLLTGTVPGEVPVIMARDNSSTPKVVIVSPGDGAVIISGTTVTTYPDADVGQPNSVFYGRGFFQFTYGDGTLRASDVNSYNINTLSVATAESKPDTLFRGLPLGNGQFIEAGSDTMEVWGGQVNDTGYPWNYIATIPRGIVGPYAIAGMEDGWGKGLYFVGDDFKVSRLNGYTPEPVSYPDVDLAIENEADKTNIRVGVFIAGGHSFVMVQGTNWCWIYIVDGGFWFEGQSYLKTIFRRTFPVKAFGKWLCGDLLSGNLLEISNNAQDELNSPLRMRIETGPLGAFPQAVRINGIELYLTKGVGIATGSDPVQTDPDVEISVSRDGGNVWSNPRVIKVGRQALMAGRVRSSIWGQADVQGVRWRFDQSSNVPFGFMGADMQQDVLR